MDCAEAESQADALTPRTMRAVVCGHDALSFNVHVHAVKSFICTQWPTGSSSKARWSGDRSAAQSCCQVCHWQALKGPWRQEKVVHSGALSCPKTAMPIQRGTSNSQSEWGGKFATHRPLSRTVTGTFARRARANQSRYHTQKKKTFSGASSSVASNEFRRAGYSWTSAPSTSRIAHFFFLLKVSTCLVAGSAVEELIGGCFLKMK